MTAIARELRDNPLLWLLIAVPAVFAVEHLAADAHTALRAGMLDLVKASIAGAIVTNSLFMLGMSLLLGGLRHHAQEYNRETARLQSGMLLLAAIALLIPSAVGGADRQGAAAFAAARKNRLDLSVGIALGSSAQIALFVAPVLVLASLFIAPVPMDMRFWPGAVVMVMISTLAVAFVTSSGRSAWYVGVLLLVVYASFALTLYLPPPPDAG